MKKLLIAGLVAFSILLSPFTSTSFDAVAGRTTHGDGGEECACGMPAPPICYDEATWQRCDSSSGQDSDMMASSDESKTSEDVPVDYSSGILMLLVAAFFTSRAIRFP
jgi:hypothetical protein